MPGLETAGDRKRNLQIRFHLHRKDTHAHTQEKRGRKGQSWKERETERQREQARGEGAPSKPTFSGMLPPARLHPAPRMFLNSTTYWAPSVQILELSGTLHVHIRTTVRAWRSPLVEWPKVRNTYPKPASQTRSRRESRRKATAIY